jgi:hypothetical protein
MEKEREESKNRRRWSGTGKEDNLWGSVVVRSC